MCYFSQWHITKPRSILQLAAILEAIFNVFTLHIDTNLIFILLMYSFTTKA